jgi:hypothetical protein
LTPTHWKSALSISASWKRHFDKKSIQNVDTVVDVCRQVIGPSQLSIQRAVTQKYYQISSNLQTQFVDETFGLLRGSLVRLDSRGVWKRV